MKRRNFLRGSAISLLALPAWLSCAFQRGGVVDFNSPEEVIDNSVGRAFLRAQKLGKPLMVIVVPKDASQKYDRGHAWGEFLNFGALWPMALCEVICANEAELSALVPVSGEPLFYLVESSAGEIKATPYQAELPSFSESLRKYDEGSTAGVDARIKALNVLVKSALAKDGAMLKARAAVAEAALGEEATRFKGRVGKTTLEEADLFAAILANESLKNTTALGLAAESRLKARKVEGSRWTLSSGCGPDVHEDATAEEREQQGMYDCGMGFVPDKSQRFLTFYTSTSTT